MTNFHLISLCLFLTFRSIAGAIECPSGFVMNGDSCYYFSDEAKSWTDAATACNDLGAYLVEINGDDENNFLIDQVLELKERMWTGANDKDIEGKFEWKTSQTDVEDLGTWEPGNPSGGGEDCMEMNYRRRLDPIVVQWNDRFCSTSLPYICEKSFTCTFDKK